MKTMTVSCRAIIIHRQANKWWCVLHALRHKHTNTQTHKQTRTRKHPRTHTHAHTHMRTHKHVYAYTHSHTRAHPHTHSMHKHAYAYAHSHTYKCTYLIDPRVEEAEGGLARLEAHVIQQRHNGGESRRAVPSIKKYLFSVLSYFSCFILLVFKPFFACVMTVNAIEPYLAEVPATISVLPLWITCAPK